MCHPVIGETVRRRVQEEGLPRFDRRTALLAGAGAALTAALPARALGSNTPTNRLQDLTHVFREGFPMFLGAPPGPDREVVVTVPVNGFYGLRWTFWEHTATHLDVPAHFVEHGRTSPEMSLDELVRPVVVIDISARASSDPDAVVLPEDLRRFEHAHGRIPRGAVVCMYSGWEARVGSEAAYRNVGPDGLQHFPGFGKAAVERLIAERDIAGIGVDTLSLDHGRSTTFDVHLTVLAANRYGIENLANLAKIPPRGATIIVGLIPWELGSGGPARVFARW
ncbi:MAG: cyclase family protein [Gaiellaceae bacterium]